MRRANDYVRHEQDDPGVFADPRSRKYKGGYARCGGGSEPSSRKRWMVWDFAEGSVPETDGQGSPKALVVHGIASSYATHKHATAKAWLTRHSCFQIRFTPIVSFWMNSVMRFFADPTGECTRKGNFQRVRARIEVIEDPLDDRNANPICYVWRARGEDIFKTFACAKEAPEAQSR